jgi:hypothetical protein
MSRPHPAPFRLLRVLILACTLVLTSTAASCDEDEPSGPGSGIAGLWMSEDEEVVLDITASRVSVLFLTFDECYELDARYDIVDRDGDTFTLEDDEGDDFELEVERDGDELLVTEGEFTQEFFEIDDDDFDEC